MAFKLKGGECIIKGLALETSLSCNIGAAVTKVADAECNFDRKHQQSIHTSIWTEYSFSCEGEESKDQKVSVPPHCRTFQAFGASFEPSAASQNG